MNERIRELAEQAERLAEDELAYLERVHNRLYSFTEGREIYNQKFAELIVRECLSIIERRKRWIDNENGNTDNLWTHGYEKAINHCSMFIKEYLGVYE